MIKWTRTSRLSIKISLCHLDGWKLSSSVHPKVVAMSRLIASCSRKRPVFVFRAERGATTTATWATGAQKREPKKASAPARRTKAVSVIVFARNTSGPVFTEENFFRSSTIPLCPVVSWYKCYLVAFSFLVVFHSRFVERPNSTRASEGPRQFPRDSAIPLCLFPRT